MICVVITIAIVCILVTNVSMIATYYYRGRRQGRRRHDAAREPGDK